MSMKIVPKTLAGILHNFNKGAIDWGWQGLVSYGCQNSVVIVDPKTIQVLQTLDKHKGYVTKVKWSSENYHHDVASSYNLRLASADFNGRIIVWDVAQASVLSEFADGSKPITEIQWLSQHDNSQDLLVALHPPYNLILWNAATGTRVWKKSYTEVLRTFSFDPFDHSRLTFLGQDCIVFVEDFSVTKIPSDNGRKYFISSPTNASSMSHSSSAEKIAAQKSSSKQTLTRRMTNILVGDTGKRSPESSEEPSLVNDCLQLVHHATCRYHLILLYPREVLILDLEVNQTVSVIPAERNGSPYSQVISLRQRDMLMCLHENGSVTVRLRRKQPTPCTSTSPEQSAENCLTNAASIDVAYDLRCQSDPLRVTKNSRVYGIVACPVNENKIALIMSDSRLLLWQLKTIDHQNYNNGLQPMSPLFAPGQTIKPLPSLTETPLAPPPKVALCDLIGHSRSLPDNLAKADHMVQLKFLLTGLLSGVAPPPFVIRMCPPLTTKNWAVYQPLLALGTFSGLIQVYNLASGQLHRELSVHTSAVRGIEWVSLVSFLSYAHPNQGQNGLVKNEVYLTDIQTGKCTPFRANKDEESPIDGLRVSYLKQYFVIMFKDKPFELWDLHTGTLLRQMPKNFPHVTALEWSPSHNLKTLKKKLSSHDSSGSSVPADMITSSTMTSSTAADPTTRSETGKAGHTVREHFVFTDADGLMYHFIVEGNMIKDGSKIPPDGGMGSITSIAWKAETLVLGDVDGNINLWDLKARVSRAVPTGRGWIKKLKFAPGRGNMKLLVLFNDGADVWDAKDVVRVSSLKSPKDVAKLTDIDWAASDRPVMACTDGCVRVLDMEFATGCSPLEINLLSEPVFCPHLLPAKATLTMKSMLQHQNWSEQYTLHLEETEQNADITKLINEQLQLLDEDVKEYLPTCHYGVAQRCLLTARLFGDESEVTFWTVALHYLREEKAEPASMKIHRSTGATSSGDIFIPSTPAREAQDLLVFETETGSTGRESWCHVKDAPLETSYDVLCDSATFQHCQLERVSVHDNKRATHEHARKCAESLVLLGETDRAVQVLLETEADNDNYYTDSLRACLVASIRSSGASQSTIKLVATNLIANGKLMEGVQLLCLIDKGLDACRYLQTYGWWNKAAWLAKATLSHAECCEVLKRWADHLCSPQVNRKSKAILVLLSIGQFVRVIELLYSMRYFDRAALFIEACQQFQLLPATDDVIIQLVEAVFLEYARHLLQLGNRRAFNHYCHLAGDKGKLLAKEIDTVYSEND